MEQPSTGRTARALIEDARAREEALSKVQWVMEQATGTAHDRDNTIELTVDAQGKLMNLWLAPSASRWGAERLGSLIVEVAQVAMDEATQNSYNQVALLLGENMTSLIEQLSGKPAPARAAGDDASITQEDFQRRRDERLGRAGQEQPPVPSSPPADDELETFDPATLRSDR